MARNKYPEETVNLILDVSFKLFAKNGYDKTSIQDIIEHLGGLSKGAIYHHFKSKESILLAVYERMAAKTETEMYAIRDDSSLSGLEKLRKMFMFSLRSLDNRELIALTPNLMDNPQFLAIQLSNTMNVVVPRYIEPVIREGIADGSIQTKYPRELADVLILISNVWLNPLIYPITKENVADKIAFFRELTEKLGLSMLDEGIAGHLSEIQKMMQKA